MTASEKDPVEAPKVAAATPGAKPPAPPSASGPPDHTPKPAGAPASEKPAIISYVKPGMDLYVAEEKRPAPPPPPTPPSGPSSGPSSGSSCSPYSSCGCQTTCSCQGTCGCERVGGGSSGTSVCRCVPVIH